MQNLTYKEIQKIEMSATEKLLNYISDKIQKEEIPLDNIEFYYPDFSENKYRLAFNVWLSIDYIDEDGKTFIEKLLEDKSVKLTPEERQLLAERNKSILSLHQILSIDGEFIKALDLLKNETYDLWEPELSRVFSAGDYIFARTGRLFGNMSFVGDISYLPPSMKDIFLEEVFIDFNRVRSKYPNLTIKEYLKKYTINLYKIYTDCIFQAIEVDDDIIATLHDEIDEFEAYLEIKNQGVNIKKHLSNLMEFFEYYLVDENLTLYDCNLIDFNLFFQDAIENGFITSQEDLNSYISTFKDFLKFLSSKDESYKEAYKEILNISKRRFELMNKLNTANFPFKINKGISNIVVESLNKEAIAFLMDYDKFLLYVFDKPLDLTKKNKYIRKHNLFEINDMLENAMDVNKKSITQKDFTIIDLFYRFSLSFNILVIENDTLKFTENASSYLKLKDEDKYTLFIQYILSNEFLKGAVAVDSVNILEIIKRNLIDVLYSLKIDKRYDMGKLMKMLIDSPKIIFRLCYYLNCLGIINCIYYPYYELSITPLGKKLAEYLKFADENKKQCNLIKLELHKKN